MGDIIHALPLAENAARAGATVGWVVESPYRELLESNPSVARVFAADTRAWRSHPFAAPREIAALRAALRRFAPHLTIDAQGLWKSALSGLLAGAPVVGFARGGASGARLGDSRPQDGSARSERPARRGSESRAALRGRHPDCLPGPGRALPSLPSGSRRRRLSRKAVRSLRALSPGSRVGRENLGGSALCRACPPARGRERPSSRGFVGPGRRGPRRASLAAPPRVDGAPAARVPRARPGFLRCASPGRGRHGAAPSGRCSRNSGRCRLRPD